MFEEYLESFRNFLEGNNSSEKTIGDYLRINRELIKFVQEKNIQSVEDVKTVHLDLYQSHIMKINRSTSVRTKMNAVRAFFNYLESREFIEKNPVKKLTKVKIKDTDKKKKDSLTVEEAFRLVEYTEKNSIPSMKLRNKMIMMCFIFFGLRISELCNLKVSDIKFNEDTIYITGKGNKIREIPISRTIEADLKEYMQSRPVKSEYLFTVKKSTEPVKKRGIRALIYDHASKARIRKKHIHPHMLRRTTATILDADGKEISAIQYFLGHSDMSTTLIYINRNKEELKREVKENNSLTKKFEKEKKKKQKKAN